MKAARLHSLRSELRIDRVNVPRIGAGEVLVDVRASGLCHSDINYRDGIAPVATMPITLGHEIAGVVTEKGSRVKSAKEGDRVIVHYISSCGHCQYCLSGRENYCSKYLMIGKDIDGGFAEYVRVPASSLVKLSESIPFEQGAIMGCAVPTAYHALQRARIQEKETVMVVGVGGLGMHAIQLAKRVFKSGRTIAVDRFRWKLEKARQFGATDTINAGTQEVQGAVEKITSKKMADVVLDFVGSERTIQLGVECVGKGGRLILVGIGAKIAQISPYSSVIGKEMAIIGVNDHLRTDLTQLVKLVGSKRLDLSHSITHRVPLDEINRGFSILESLDEKPIRVVASKEY
jgi:2-desacetyl-2-hydroxyethyl bacteriochlorophyllide A dehydrogenase